MKIKGNSKPNELIGTDEDDKIFGMEGDDTITAKGGHDDVDGGDGDDKITIAANTSATIDAGKGDDKVKLSAAALGSEANLGKGNDIVDIKDSAQTNQVFTIAGGKGDDGVKFALDQDDYTSVTKDGDGAFTITDVNGNTYTISSIETLTFNGALYQEPTSPPNTAPVVSNPIADQTANEDNDFSFQFASNVFTDAENDPLTYTATLADGSALPGWLSFDATTRTFSGTPGASDVGTISVLVTASDGSLSENDEFSITITDDGSPNPAVTGGVLYLTNSFDYDVSESGGVILVQFGGNSVSFASADVNSVFTRGSNSVDIDTQGWLVRGIDGDVNYTNVTFTQAGPGTPDVKFESTFELGPDAIPVNGEATVNGSAADYFRAAWDYLDNNYPSGEANNSAFVDLGIQYAKYLAAGNPPLIDDIAKYTDSNDDLVAERMQTLHDNLLGNLDERYFANKFGAEGTGGIEPSEIYDRIVNAGLADYVGTEGNFDDGRGSFTGNISHIGGTAHDQVRAFDYDQGWHRTDYVDAYFGTVDGAASKDTNSDSVDDSMLYGTGNSNVAFSVLRHEGAGVELALKAKEYGPSGGDTLGLPTFDADGTAHYSVNTGPSQSNANRADWSIDYAATVLASGQDDSFTFKLFIDIDETAGEQLVEVPMTTYSGFEQGSTNYAFFTSLIDIDDTAAGVQPYAFGIGDFSIELQAYDSNGDLILENKMVVHVDH